VQKNATGVDTSVRSSGKTVIRPATPIKIIDLAAVSAPKKTA
jgi:hypothetical protein